LRYLFEEYVFDTGRRELHRGADVVSVAPQVIDFLDYLIATGSASSARMMPFGMGAACPMQR
jgi:DNA-binding winged helix-turn-helix (wHTH) protein